MSVNVIYEYPGRGSVRRFLSLIARLLGALLILCGLIAAVAVVILLGGVLLLVSDGKAIRFDSSEVVNFGIAAASMIILFWLGRRLLRGRRQLVLFLRRFGFVAATETLTFALATAMGRSWRLVTLDDHEVAPVGAGKGIRWTSVIVGLIACAVVATAVYWFYSGGIDRVMRGAAGSQPVSRDNPIGDIFGRVLAAAIAAVVVGIMVALPSLFLAVIAVFSFGSYISVRRAEKSKSLSIATQRKIEPLARKVARRARRVLSPRLTVVRVAGAVWQETVRRLALVSAAIVIDVSEPTPNLLWEIETLKPDLRSCWILVAELQHLNSFAGTTGQNLAVNRRLFELLDGEDILAYSIDREGKKRFARALRGKLDGMSSSRPKALRA